MSLTVSELWYYPIKSCAGIRMEEAEVGIRGFAGDRECMIVDRETGMFVAQRDSRGLGITIRSMCQIVPRSISPDCLELSAPGMPTIKFSRLLMLNARDHYRQVQVWDWQDEAMVADPRTNAWFTEFLSRERPGDYQLVVFHHKGVRRAKIGNSQLRFADAYPFLVIGQKSLDDLNGRIGSDPLPMNRFRPNIVIRGGAPYDEDQIGRMVIGDGVELEGKTLCERCPVPCTDQVTAVLGKEPNRTLASYRRGRHLVGLPVPNLNGVYFGRNFNHLSTGRIRVGDEVNVIA